MDTGGKIRTGKMLEELSRRTEITLISNVEHPKDDPYVGEIGRLCTRFVSVPWREPRRHTVRFYLRLFRQSMRSLPVSALNDYSAELKRAVEAELSARPYDLAVCDFVQSSLMFRDVSNVPTLLFQHNVESEIARRHVLRSSSALARLFWRLQWRRMRRFEESACRRFDTVVAVSQGDAEQMCQLYGLSAVQTIPTGVDADYYQSAPDSESRRRELVFCGSMDWLPNQDAMTFFIADVLPIVRAAVPDVRLTIVGRNPSPSLERLVRQTSGVRLTGWVEDTRPYIGDGQVFIVPLRIGGGTRMKIYEGMAMRRAVLSTSIGAEGLDCEGGKHLVIADGAEPFAAETVSLLNDARRRNAIAEAGREHVSRHFSWPRVSDAFLEICRHTATRHPHLT